LFLLGSALLCAQEADPSKQAPTANISNQSRAVSPTKDLTNAGDILSSSLTPKVVEDWSTPSLKGSELVPTEPIEGDIDHADPAYDLEYLRMQWRPADDIDLYIMKPTGIAKPPVILYLYSYPYDNDRYQNGDFRRFLTKRGFAAVGFVSALTGQRYHSPRPMKEWFVSQLSESLATSAHDVQMILNYLAKRGDFDMSDVGMYGEGSGASIAILAAAVDPRIKSLDLVNPWGDWPDWMAKSTLIPENERPDFVKPEFLSSIAPLDPVEWLPKLKGRKIRLQEVEDVTVTPDEARKKIEAATPPNVEITHYDDTKAFARTISLGVGFDWIKLQMQMSKPQEYQAERQRRTTGSSERKR